MNWRTMVLDFNKIAPSENELSGLVFDIQKFAVHDGGGIRTLVFLKGCPLRCQWCSNPESLARKPQLTFIPNNCISCGACFNSCASGAIRRDDRESAGWSIDRQKCTLCGSCAKTCYAGAINIIGRYLSVSELMAIVERDRKFYEASNGGVTFSGGEPTAQPEFLESALREMRDRGIHTAIETSSFVPWDTLEPILRHVDLVLTDIKHMDDSEHRRLTGVSNRPVLENLQAISRSGIPMKVRLPLIPGINDSESNLAATAEFVKRLETLQSLDILPYHRLGEGKWRQLGEEYSLSGLKPKSDTGVEEVTAYFSRQGIRVEIGG